MLLDVDNLAIAFPDEGAWKRFHMYFTTGNSSWPTITCIKIREGDKRVVRIREGERGREGRGGGGGREDGGRE